MRYHLAKRRSTTSARAGDKWKFCNKGFHSFIKGFHSMKRKY